MPLSEGNNISNTLWSYAFFCPFTFHQRNSPLNWQRLLLIVLLGVTTTCSYADTIPSRVSFQHLLKDKDIALGEVQAFHQDKHGFMWIGGGGGLIRYDGYNFKFVNLKISTPKGMEVRPIKMVNDIYQDENEILWISTRTGIFHYDPRSEVLSAIPDDPNAALTISTNTLWKSLDLPTGELAIAGLNGLFILDKTTLQYEVILPDSENPNSLHGAAIRDLYVDSNNVLWLATGEGLEKVNWEKQEFTLYKPYAERPDLLRPNTVAAISVDEYDNMWLGTIDGLVYFNPKTLERRRYIHDLNDPSSFCTGEVADMIIDVNGALWVATDGGGLAILEKTDQYPNGPFKTQYYSDGRAGALSSDQVRTVYEDNAGDIWVGNYPTGINYFDRSTTAIISYEQSAEANSLSLSSILDVQEDSQGNLWLGTDGGGLNFFDREKDTFTSYENEPGDPFSLSGNAILGAYLDDEGKLWAGTWAAGISVFDPKTKKFTRLPYDAMRPKTVKKSQSNRLNSSTVWSIKEDSRKNLWISTHTGGLSKYDRDSGIYTHYEHMVDDPTSITHGIVWDVFEDSKGNLWVGTSTGLDVMDRDTEIFRHYKTDPNDPTSLSNPSATAIIEDSKNRIWIGTEAGLNLLNPDGETFTVYKQSDGFTDDNIRKIMEDKSGKLWLSTNNGISVFDPETEQIKNYNRDSGRLMGGFHTDAGIISSKGEIIFGGVEGLRIIDPTKLVANENIPPVVLTDLKIFADSIKVGAEDGVLEKSISFTDTIVLDYTQSMFQIEFSALNFRNPVKNNYAYRLKGFDDSWLKVNTQRTARYTNLDPGSYTFQVKGSNNDGVWNEIGRSLKIVQQPPPWLTWWAYLLYFIALVLLIAFFIDSQRRKRRKVEEQNRLLEIKVGERTAELREKNEDIQQMLSNMRQGLFTIESTVNIHPEYSEFLEDIFETKDIAGTNAVKLLFNTAKLSSDIINQQQEAINSIIGEDELNYDFNSHLLVQEYEMETPTSVKFLSLDWNPISSDGSVVKLMVSVRDVTRLRQMESEARTQKRELNIIGQLLNVSAKKYQVFIESILRFINDNRTHIENNERPNKKTVALLFRNMHTVKGNCRTYNFTYIGEMAHDIETVYSEINKNTKMEWDRQKLLDDLSQLEVVCQEYERIYYKVLGREKETSRDTDGFWMNKKTVQEIRQCINSTNQKFPELLESRALTSIERVLDEAFSTPLKDVLADEITALPSIALQLGKDEPNIIFRHHDLLIQQWAVELLTNVFTHILRNCIDHGIEPPEQRLLAGKSEAGEIIITADVQSDSTLLIRVKDDGQGIDIGRLFNLGLAAGEWTQNSTPSKQQIANLIFVSGITTKDKVTDISGRGVGLDAVKELLRSSRSDIVLTLLSSCASEAYDDSNEKIPFELCITLPEDSYIACDFNETDKAFAQ